MADVGAHIFDFFRSHGYTPAAAAGIIGNFQQESSLNPSAAGGGLDQGQGARFHAGDLNAQLHGILGELQGSEAHTAAAVRGLHDPRKAALLFSQMFERPGIPENGKRETYAQEALQRYGGREVAHASAAGAIANELAPHLEPQGANAAQTADIATLLTSALAAQHSGAAPATAPAAPQANPNPLAPKIPQAAAAAPQTDPTAVLSVLSKLAAEQSPLPTAQEGGTGEASLGTQAPTGSAADLTSRKGIVDFGGHKVAAWIAPILRFAESRGVKPQITSGYRSKAEQERIYNSGVRPAAVPGTSNHEGDAFPRGAVDIANAAAVAKVLKGTPYEKLLAYAGVKDPVHFSHPHNGSY